MGSRCPIEFKRKATKAMVIARAQALGADACAIWDFVVWTFYGHAPAFGGG